MRTGLHVLDALFGFDATQWREYEPGWGDGCDEDTICWIERLSGDRDVRAQLEAGVDPDQIVAGYQAEVDAFDELAQRYRIYR